MKLLLTLLLLTITTSSLVYFKPTGIVQAIIPIKCISHITFNDEMIMCDDQKDHLIDISGKTIIESTEKNNYRNYRYMTNLEFKIFKNVIKKNGVGGVPTQVYHIRTDSHSKKLMKIIKDNNLRIPNTVIIFSK